MKNSYLALALAALALASAPAFADTIGTTVTGALYFGSNTNYFNPTNGYVPNAYSNHSGTSVVIGSNTEFGFQDNTNLDTANFTGTTLTITDVTSNHNSASDFQMVFTDPAFASISLLSNSFGDDLQYSLHNGTLTIDLPGTWHSGTRTVTFSISSPTAATPEPGTFVFLGTGLLGAVGAIRRKFTA